MVKGSWMMHRHPVRRQWLPAAIVSILLLPYITAVDLLDLAPEQLQLLEKHAREVSEHNTIVISQTACSYLAFVDNWILHAKRLGINNYLIVAEDQVSLDYMNEKHPHHALSSALFGYDLADKGLRFMEWGTTEFGRIACKRPKFIGAFLLMGYNVIWTDMDTVWLESPSPLVPLHYDYVGVQENCRNGCELNNTSICTCFMHMRPTNRALCFLTEWHTACSGAGRDLSMNDQDHFNVIFKASGVPYLDYYIMPLQLYPSGAYADKNAPLQLHKVKSEEFKAAGSSLQPAWVHANFRTGKNSKKMFLQHHGVWEVEDSVQIPGCPM